MAHRGHILICITGGIAAYKMATAASTLAQANLQVDVAMTAAAVKFIGPATFEGLTGRKVHLDIWDHPADSNQPRHIQLPTQADLVVVAPATADALAKLAGGLADDLVSTLLLATPVKKLLVAPAMNEGMWIHPATQNNIQRLRDWGVEIIGPESGWQACRTVGPGRMVEPDVIVAAVQNRLGSGEISTT
jgi:phosphopantothenoylcysteine decarboxylase/phosphopantothenate--cysteine ligase